MLLVVLRQKTRLHWGLLPLLVWCIWPLALLALLFDKSRPPSLSRAPESPRFRRWRRRLHQYLASGSCWRGVRLTARIRPSRHRRPTWSRRFVWHMTPKSQPVPYPDPSLSLGS